ncbi:hypothetical protein [Halorhodospira sp. 9622]|uniref:hypothetical protein n=1 Tax=Halorhodospira sp. 9622 TaxID=2899136 RepID=UPI001EE8DB16|nr:hypothetical protein [Halorhodospira sp. 9622]MCG5537354.1 hypothetical protein [Halorhodospira sp. 9622]
MTNSQQQFSASKERWTEGERRLINATRDGGIANLSALDDTDRHVSAALIVDLATNAFEDKEFPQWRLHANGLFLRGAIINKKIDLINRRAPASLVLDTCTLKEGLTLEDSRIDGRVFLNNSTIDRLAVFSRAYINGQFAAINATFRGRGGPAIKAQGVKATGWFMDNAEVNGLLRINSMELSGQFSADNANFFGEKDEHDRRGRAINAQDAKAKDWFMREAEVNGTFTLTSAEIDDQVETDNSTFNGCGRPAITAQGVKATRWAMDNSKVNGLLTINSTKLSGQFSAVNAVFFGERDEHGRRGRAIHAQDAKANDWFMQEAEVNGTFALTSAEIADQVKTDNSTFNGCGGPAITAQGVKATSWVMRKAEIKGLFDIAGSNINGPFMAERSTFHDNLLLQYGTFRGGIFLRGANTTKRGVIALYSATIEKTLDFREATLKTDRAVSLDLQAANVHGDTKFKGACVHGCINAGRTRFTGLVELKARSLMSAGFALEDGESDPNRIGTFSGQDSARALYVADFTDARVDGRLIMPDKQPWGIISLSHAYCDAFEDSEGGWPEPPNEQKNPPGLLLHGFECNYFVNPAGSPTTNSAGAGPMRIKWLDRQSAEGMATHFNPQPWRQTASVLRRMGYYVAAKEVAIARLRRERRAPDSTRFQSFVSSCLDSVADYGFSPWKTVSWSLFIVVACALLYGCGAASCGGSELWDIPKFDCDDEKVFMQVRHGSIEGSDGTYPAFSALAYSADMFIPILDLGAESYWRANTEAWFYNVPIGHLMYWLSFFQRFIGAILVAITVTSFMGLLTRGEQ